MRMVQELDAGPVIHQARVPIQEDETFGELQLRLSELGAMALIEALTLLSVGAAKEVEQDNSLATYAPKITREMARIDWSKSGSDVARLIRAYDPKPSAYTTHAGSDIKLFGASAVANSSDAAPGTVLLTSDTLIVACGEGAVSITDVQPSGKKRMRTSEWSRGRGVREGDRFGD